LIEEETIMELQKKEDYVKRNMEEAIRRQKAKGREIDDFTMEMFEHSAESSFDGMIKDFEYYCNFLRCKDFSIDNIEIPMKLERIEYYADTVNGYHFSVTYNDLRYFVEIVEMIKPRHNFNYEVSVYIVDFPEVLSYDTSGKVLYCLMTASVESLEDTARVVACAYGINADRVKINFIDPTVKVVVHQITDFGLYHFKIDNDVYLAMVKTSGEDYNTYNIEILKNQHDIAMLSVEGSKSGRLFKSVLLKKLNDWFKEIYCKRAKFVWGQDSQIS
jgi:hypothetical protein